MTLMCIDRSQSPTHKGSFLQGGKSSSNNLNQHRRHSCNSPPLSKNHNNNQDTAKSPPPAKLERSASDSGTRGQSNSSRYKTELCRTFEESGTCKYGDKCQFAHGVKELRSMARHPKYKTELCRTFHSTGFCPYGSRCHFIHNSEQTKKELLTNLTATTPSPPIATTTSRPKALSSLGSAGDVSPASSHGGTPTGLKSFDDLYYSSSLSPGLPVFPAQDSPFVNSLVNSLQRYDFADRDFDGPTCSVFGDAVIADAPLDNYSYQGGPVLDLFQTAPLTPPTPLDANTSVFRFQLYDLFQKQ